MDNTAEAPGGTIPTTINLECSNRRTWVEHLVDLSPWKGRGVKIRFKFDVLDPTLNESAGWLVVNFRIVTDDCAANKP